LSYTRPKQFEFAERTRQRQAAEQRISELHENAPRDRWTSSRPRVEGRGRPLRIASVRRSTACRPSQGRPPLRERRRGQPELSHRPSALEQCRPGAPRGVDREIGDTASCPAPRALLAPSHIRLRATKEHHFAKMAPLPVAPASSWRVDTPWIGATGGRPGIRAKIFL